MIASETITHHRDTQAIFEGVLLGTAAGDALGLPAEGLSAGRIRRLWNGDWKMRFVFGRGMISDDTEHTLMVAQSLLSHPEDPITFQRALAWKFRWWFAGLPAGVGLATAKACLKLWIGFSPAKSSVNSAGDGPAMRSAVIGAFFADNAKQRREFVLASSRLTHKGWKAETAALAVAEAAALAASNPGRCNSAQLFESLRLLSLEREWQDCVARMESALEQNNSVQEFAHALGVKNGISGYAFHAVPVALYAWLRHPADFRTALTATLDCGGDTDTVGAIVGALCGANSSPNGIPREWLDNIVEWPRSIEFIQKVAKKLAQQKECPQPLGEVPCFLPGIIVRNILFLLIVLGHGFRRLLPPY